MLMKVQSKDEVEEGLHQDLRNTKGGIAQHGSLKQRSLYLSSRVTLRSSQPHQSPKKLEGIPSVETQKGESLGKTEGGLFPRCGKQSLHRSSTSFLEELLSMGPEGPETTA